MCVTDLTCPNTENSTRWYLGMQFPTSEVSKFIIRTMNYLPLLREFIMHCVND